MRTRVEQWGRWLAAGLGAGWLVAGAAPEEAPVLMSTETVEATPAWATLPELIAAAEGGDATAAFQYAQLLEFGDQVEADAIKAREFYEAAAAGGNANAAFRLGKAYHDDTLGLARDRSRSPAFYRAAVPEVPEASFNLGAMYVSGRGVKRDYVEGLAWLLIARDQGAGGEAVKQVKERLARYPERIAAAEKRAEVLRKEIEGPPAEKEANAQGAAKDAAAKSTVPAPARGRPAAPVAPITPTSPTMKPDVAPPAFKLSPPSFSLPPPPPPASPAEPEAPDS